MRCPRCGAKHPIVATVGATGTRAPNPFTHEVTVDPDLCLRAALQRIDALEQSLVEIAREAAIAGQPVSSAVGG